MAGIFPSIKMDVPRKSMSRKWHKDQKPPIEQSRYYYEENDTDKVPRKSKRPVDGFECWAVGSHDEGPELV